MWCSSVLQCAALWCSVLQCLAVCNSVLQCAAMCRVSQCVAVCCSVLRCAAVCCGVLQCSAMCCSVLQSVAECQCALRCNKKISHNVSTSLFPLLFFFCTLSVPFFMSTSHSLSLIREAYSIFFCASIFFPCKHFFSFVLKASFVTLQMLASFHRDSRFLTFQRRHMKRDVCQKSLKRDLESVSSLGLFCHTPNAFATNRRF